MVINISRQICVCVFIRVFTASSFTSLGYARRRILLGKLFDGRDILLILENTSSPKFLSWSYVPDRPNLLLCRPQPSHSHPLQFNMRGTRMQRVVLLERRSAPETNPETSTLPCATWSPAWCVAYAAASLGQGWNPWQQTLPGLRSLPDLSCILKAR